MFSFVILSGDFMPMEKLFAWQLVGDLFKVCALILGQEFFARKMTRAFIATEMLSFCVFYFSGRYFITTYGAEGAVMAHAFTYLLYFVVLGIYLFSRTDFETPGAIYCTRRSRVGPDRAGQGPTRRAPAPAAGWIAA